MKSDDPPSQKPLRKLLFQFAPTPLLSVSDTNYLPACVCVENGCGGGGSAGVNVGEKAARRQRRIVDGLEGDARALQTRQLGGRELAVCRGGDLVAVCVF